MSTDFDCNSDWYKGIERGKIIERVNSVWKIQAAFVAGVLVTSLLVGLAVWANLS